MTSCPISKVEVITLSGTTEVIKVWLFFFLKKKPYLFERQNNRERGKGGRIKGREEENLDLLVHPHDLTLSQHSQVSFPQIQTQVTPWIGWRCHDLRPPGTQSMACRGACVRHGGERSADSSIWMQSSSFYSTVWRTEQASCSFLHSLGPSSPSCLFFSFHVFLASQLKYKCIHISATWLCFFCFSPLPFSPYHGQGDGASNPLTKEPNF